MLVQVCTELNRTIMNQQTSLLTTEKLTITNETFSTTETSHSNHIHGGALASGFTLGATKAAIINTAESPCAAGWRCSMMHTTGGSTIPNASARHRCPGLQQDFLSCNKPIHAICGIEIETPRNGDMFNRMCFDCVNMCKPVPLANPEPIVQVVPEAQMHTSDNINNSHLYHQQYSQPSLQQPTNNKAFTLLPLPIRTDNEHAPQLQMNTFGHNAITSPLFQPNSQQPTNNTLFAIPPAPIRKVQNPYLKKTPTQSTQFRKRGTAFGTSRTIEKTKQLQVYFTCAVPQAQENMSEWKYKLAIFIRAHNSMTKDNGIIEFKPEIFNMMCELVYSTKDTDSEVRIGSMNGYTDLITSSFSEVHRIRANPGEEDDSYKTSGNNGYYSEQIGGMFEVTVQRQDQLQQELDNILQEFKNIIAGESFHHAYKYAAYWKYCNEPGTTIEQLVEKVNSQLKILGNRDQIFNKARSIGKLYPILVQDLQQTLRKVLGTTEMMVKYDVSLDEVLQNADIANYAKGMIGIYSPAYRRVLFLKDIPNRNLSFLQTNDN